MLDPRLQKAVDEITGLIELGVGDDDLESLHELVVDVLYAHWFDDSDYGTETFNPLVRGINYGIEKNPIKVWFRPYMGRPIEITQYGNNVRS